MSANRDRAGGGAEGALAPNHHHHRHFFGWFFFFFFFFYFGYQDLSLTTQTRFGNLTILNTHKQRTDKLCLVAVANEFVALNDNWKGDTQPLRVLGLASKSIHLNFGLTWGPGCNLLF